jgi:hypothetical protein
LTVELALGEKTAAECGWRLEVRDKSPVFTLINQLNSRRTAVDKAEEILKKLGCEADVAEDSPA